MSESLMLPIKAQTLTGQVFDRVVDAIVKGEIKLGSRISEASMASDMGISRGPLREALLRLEGRKLVKRVPHKGTQVIDWPIKSLIEVFQMREALEGVACRLACQNMSDQALVDLVQVLAGHEETDELRKGTAYYQDKPEVDFHFLIVRGSGNEKLVDLLCDELYYPVRIYRYRSGTTPGRARQAFGEHQAIAEAMQARDGERAEELMRAHIRRATENLERQAAEENVGAGQTD